jgi:iron complex transport system ATP-binding protein
MADFVFELRDLCFSFGRREVIKGLDWQVDPGHFYGIVGPNGCGKTTLLMLMMGYYAPKSGEVFFEGRDIRTLKRRFLATKMALVPQDFTINFDFSVFDVVMMGRYPYLPRFATPSRAEIVKVETVMEEMGISKMAGRSVMALSGGEKQRVVFARALAQDTSVLLLDEATSNMDIRHTLHCLDRVADRITSGKTAIGVFHDLNLAAMYCDRLVFMKEGTIVYAGETETVFNEETIALVFGVKSEIICHPLTADRQVLFYKRDVS